MKLILLAIICSITLIPFMINEADASSCDAGFVFITQADTCLPEIKPYSDKIYQGGWIDSTLQTSVMGYDSTENKVYLETITTDNPFLYRHWIFDNYDVNKRPNNSITWWINSNNMAQGLNTGYVTLAELPCSENPYGITMNTVYYSPFKTISTLYIFDVDCPAPPTPVIIPIITPTIEPTPEPETPKKRSSNGGCSDCTPPTLGLNSKGSLLVKDGIKINGHSEDGGYYHTNYPMQYTTLDKANIISLKYYENSGPQNIKVVQLGIGVKEIGTSINNSQAIIEVWLDDFAGDIDNPLIKEIKVIDPDNIISNTFASVSLDACDNSNGNNLKLSDSFENKQEFYENLVNSTCLITNFSYSYDKIPDSWVLSSNAIDYNRNTFNNYFNDGLMVIDESPIASAFSPEPTEPECNDPIQKVMTRNHCTFNDLKLSEANRALQSLK